ncbi:MAG: SDR family oxidoreductase [Chloroflexota bacterium]
MILVVGATGMLGSQVCRRLADRVIPFRALVRPSSDPAKIHALREMGAEIVTGDLRDASGLEPAIAGADQLICTVSSMPFSYVPGENDIATTDHTGMKALIDAAVAAGVDRFTYTSFTGGIALDFPLARAKRETEAVLITSGMDWTILRPSYFMDVWLTPAVGFDPANARATVYGTGAEPISWIAIKDVAELAVRTTLDPAGAHSILELGGPEALTPLQVVRLYESLMGRTFIVTHIPDDALAAQQHAQSDPMQQSFTALMRCYAQGDPIDMTRTLRSWPVVLTSVAEHARQTMPAVAPA